MFNKKQEVPQLKIELINNDTRQRLSKIKIGQRSLWLSTGSNNTVIGCQTFSTSAAVTIPPEAIDDVIMWLDKAKEILCEVQKQNNK